MHTFVILYNIFYLNTSSCTNTEMLHKNSPFVNYALNSFEK